MSATLLKDHQFHEYCKVLKIPQNQLVPSDPDKKLIEKAFRKCALKTHPDKVHTGTQIMVGTRLRDLPTHVPRNRPKVYRSRRMEKETPLSPPSLPPSQS